MRIRWAVGKRVVCALASGTLLAATTVIGRVVGDADGDTVAVLDTRNQQHKVRLAAIDAPEKSQPFGNRSKQHMSYLVYGKTVAVEYTKTTATGASWAR